MKILSIIGTRPEAIKMAPVVRALAGRPGIVSRLCVTGQHREMLADILPLFGLAADRDLGLMRPGRTLNRLMADTIGALDALLAAERPDRVLVHGDTTTASAAALAAFHRSIPVGHVEAGLRTHRLDAPFPEEANRRVIDLVSDLRFAPTARAAVNLAAERLGGRTFVTGNSGIDALHIVSERLMADPALRAGIDGALALEGGGRPLLLVTGHRRESFGAGIADICAALARIARRGDVDIVYPVHMNPAVDGPVRARLGGLANVRLTAPLAFASFVRLMQRADIVLTDSGGIQEEACTFGAPILVMREVTERPEAVEAGFARLVGTDPEAIAAAVGTLLDGRAGRGAPTPAANPYGDGRAAARIAALLAGSPVDEFRPARPIPLWA